MPFEVKKYEKIKLLTSKGSNNSGNMKILPILFISLLSFFRKRKNDLRLKIACTSVAFFVTFLLDLQNVRISYYLSIFWYDTIGITNEMTTSYCQNELTIFAISKFKFKNGNSVHLLLLLLSINPGSFSNLSCSNRKTGKPLAERIIPIHLISIVCHPKLTNLEI